MLARYVTASDFLHFAIFGDVRKWDYKGRWLSSIIPKYPVRQVMVPKNISIG